MIKVYYENQSTAELVAIFADEKTYNLCLPALEKDAAELEWKITETFVEADMGNLLSVRSQIERRLKALGIRQDGCEKAFTGSKINLGDLTAKLDEIETIERELNSILLYGRI